MKLEEVKYAFNNITLRKRRSFLTMLSILMGVMSIFAIMSFGIGMQDYINGIASDAGVDKLFLQAKGMGAPGTDSNFFISQDDFDFVNKIKGVKQASPLYMRPGEIKTNGQTRYTYVMGLEPKDRDFIDESFGSTIYKGRGLRSGDIFKAVVGYNFQLPDKIFEKPVQIGDKIEISGFDFEIIGYYDEIGNPSDDANIYISHDGMEKIHPDIVEKYAWVMLQAESGVDTQVLADKIEEKLRRHKGQEEGKEDFYVQTFEDALQTFSNIIGVINGVLLLIAFISVVVAFVNIMNTMYTAVLERTKEIGVIKAIGAQNREILFIFSFESGMLGLAGGIVGIILGYTVARIGGAYAVSAGYSSLQPAFPISLVLGCAFFSFLVGLIAGLLPARQASKLKPSDALRYE